MAKYGSWVIFAGVQKMMDVKWDWIRFKWSFLAAFAAQYLRIEDS